MPRLCRVLVVLTLALLPSCGTSAGPSTGRESRLRQDVTTLAAFGTRHTLSTTTHPTRGIGAARAWLHAEFSRISAGTGNRLQVEYQTTQITEPTERIPTVPLELVNVIATLPGSAPDAERKVIVLTAHYDSRVKDVLDATAYAPGANDDGSGTALVLECARTLAAGPPLRHTIVFACLAGEEQGLHGAAALAAKARAEQWPVLAVLNNDIVGNSVGGSGQRADGRVRVFSEGVPTAETSMQLQNRQSLGGESDGPSRQLSRYIEEVARREVSGFRVVQTFRRDRYARGGDHIPFLRQGYPAVRFTEMYENFARQHADVRDGTARREGDLPEYVDYVYLANVTRINVAVLRALASAPPPPGKVTIDANLSYDATLTWEPVPSAAGYRVRYRETTAPQWQHTVDVGPATQAVLKDISKDDHQFAVESYDARGHRSVPATPTPRRR